MVSPFNSPGRPTLAVDLCCLLSFLVWFPLVYGRWKTLGGPPWKAQPGLVLDPVDADNQGLVSGMLFV